MSKFSKYKVSDGVVCRDCGKEMKGRELKNYLMWGEIQLCDGQKEGICTDCGISRQSYGETIDEIMAEFCG